MARTRGFPEPDMAKQLEGIRAAREAKESGEREAAEFHRETERRRLDDALDRLDREELERYEEVMRKHQEASREWQSSDPRQRSPRPPAPPFMLNPQERLLRRRLHASRQFAGGLTVDHILANFSPKPAPVPTDHTIKSTGNTPARVEPQPPGERVIDGQVCRTITARVHVVNPGGVTVFPLARAVPPGAEPPAGEPDSEPDPGGDAPGPVLPPGQDWRSIISDRIRDEDYSFNELGKEAGVSPAVIARFVKGERDVRVATAERLCAALDLVLVPREFLAELKGPEEGDE